MSLVQVQRSPSPSVHDESDLTDADLSRCSSRNRSMSECYFAVRGAAIILPHSEFPTTSNSNSETSAEIEHHLNEMMHLLRQSDKVVMAVRLETQIADHCRYLTIVTTSTENEMKETEERTLLIGMDYFKTKMTIGVVVPLLWCSRVETKFLNLTVYGAGNACNEEDNRLIFKPVSVSAMWYVYQFLLAKVNETQATKSAIKEPTRVTEFYMEKIGSPMFLCAQWQQSRLEEDDEEELGGIKADNVRNFAGAQEVVEKENELRNELQQIMQSVDLDTVTSKDIRNSLAQKVARSIDDHKEFIDREMLVILGQLEKASEIFPYLLLGTEWNASNWDELQKQNVGFILNVTVEVDNFFPQSFKYRKIHVRDEADTKLMMHWTATSAFIKEAKESGKVCLVHCKKGISRSASTVIAYIMKEYNWELDKALMYVKKRRNCITPNQGFMQQLAMYSGAVTAKKQQHTFDSKAQSVVEPCKNRAQSYAVHGSSSDSDGCEVRKIVDNIERNQLNSVPRNRSSASTSDRSSVTHAFPTMQRNSIPQFS